MHLSLTRWRVVMALGMAVALAACKQGEGDRCEVTSDCDDGLVCDLVQVSGTVPNTQGPLERGQCRSPESIMPRGSDAALPDASSSARDTAAPEAGADAAGDVAGSDGAGGGDVTPPDGPLGADAGAGTAGDADTAADAAAEALPSDSGAD